MLSIKWEEEEEKKAYNQQPKTPFFFYKFEANVCGAEYTDFYLLLYVNIVRAVVCDDAQSRMKWYCANVLHGQNINISK